MTEARQGVSMLGWRHPRWAGRLMIAWFLLSLVTGPAVSIHVSGGSARATILAKLIGWAFSAFLAWRVTWGGRISRMLLILADGSALIAAVVGLAIQFRLAELGVLALLTAQLALLLSPAVYRITRPGVRPGPTVALWRRRTPAPLVAAFAASAALGLAGAAVSAAMIHSRDTGYDASIVYIRPGHHGTVTLAPGHYGAFGRCEDKWGCGQVNAHSLSVLGARSGAAGVVADGPYDYERTFGGELFDRTSTFMIPVRESVRLALSARMRKPAVIAPTQTKTAVVRGWEVTAAGFGLLLLGSLAGLAWPVSRSVAGSW